MDKFGIFHANQPPLCLDQRVKDEVGTVKHV